MKQIVKGLLLLATVLVFVLIYFPIVVIALMSVNASSTGQTFTYFSFVWYGEIANNTLLLRAIGTTLFVAIISTTIATVVGTFVAIGINSLKRNQRLNMMVLNNVPVVNPDIVTGISLMVVFGLLPISFGINTMLIAHVFFSIPFVVLSVLPKLKELDKDLFDAAQDLGCTSLQAVVKVIVPAIKTGIITGALIAFTMSIDDFVISYFTTGSGVQNVSLWIYARLGRRNFSPAVYAYNTIVTVVTIVILLRLNYYSIKKKMRRLNQ
ncbi:MAG: ABC transporter permease [Candidatus Izimaplasma sp.]|nr:ABC transporter permease [Candidatus Izimaplasma bacterium]